MTLLGDLLGGAPGGAHGGAHRKGPSSSSSAVHNRKSSRGQVRPGVSFAQVTSPLHPEPIPRPPATSEEQPGWTTIHRKGKSGSWRQAQKPSPPSREPPRPNPKRRRSPSSPTGCTRCFRPDHRSEECRHLIVCLRCNCTGHTAANCPSPPRVRHPRHRRLATISAPRTENDQATVPPPPRQQIGRIKLSLPLSLDIINAKKDLQKVVVISPLSGMTSCDILATALADFVGVPSVGAISPFKGRSFLLVCEREEDVKVLTSRGKLHITSNLGPCSISVAAWSPEMGSSGKAIGSGDWVHLWNLPLHCWGWATVSQVLQPIGEMVTVKRSSSHPTVALSALVRLRPSVLLPLEVDLSIGMRRFSILLTDNKTAAPRFDAGKDSFFLAGEIARQAVSSAVCHSGASPSFTHLIPSDAKGKAKASGDHSALPELQTVTGVHRQDASPSRLPREPDRTSFTDVETGVAVTGVAATGAPPLSGAPPLTGVHPLPSDPAPGHGFPVPRDDGITTANPISLNPMQATSLSGSREKQVRVQTPHLSSNSSLGSGSELGATISFEPKPNGPPDVGSDEINPAGNCSPEPIQSGSITLPNLPWPCLLWAQVPAQLQILALLR